MTNIGQKFAIFMLFTCSSACRVYCPNKPSPVKCPYRNKRSVCCPPFKEIHCTSMLLVADKAAVCRFPSVRPKWQLSCTSESFWSSPFRKPQFETVLNKHRYLVSSAVFSVFISFFTNTQNKIDKLVIKTIGAHACSIHSPQDKILQFAKYQSMLLIQDVV